MPLHINNLVSLTPLVFYGVTHPGDVELSRWCVVEISTVFPTIITKIVYTCYFHILNITKNLIFWRDKTIILLLPVKTSGLTDLTILWTVCYLWPIIKRRYGYYFWVIIELFSTLGTDNIGGSFIILNCSPGELITIGNELTTVGMDELIPFVTRSQVFNYLHL